MALEDASELREIGFERGWWIDIRVLEEQPEVRGLLGFGRCDPVAHGLLGLGPDRLGHLVGEDPGAPQVALVAPDEIGRASCRERV